MNELAELEQGTGSIFHALLQKIPSDKLFDHSMGSDLSMLDHQFVRCISNEVAMACAPHFKTLLQEGLV
jgi:hypothetical protein